MKTPTDIIVTRHAGMVEWLRRSGIEAPVIERAQIKDIIGKRVFGVIPLRLAAFADSVVGVDMPRMSSMQIDNGVDMTADEMIDAGATMIEYKVTKQPYRSHAAKVLWGDDSDGWNLKEKA